MSELSPNPRGGVVLEPIFLGNTLYCRSQKGSGLIILDEAPYQPKWPKAPESENSPTAKK